MVSALLVSSSEKGREMLRELMRGVPEISPAVAASGAEARRLAAEVEYDLVVINAPLSDELGDGLSCTLAMDTSAGILLLVRAETADEIAEKVEDVGVMVLGKPLGACWASSRRTANCRARSRRSAWWTAPSAC